MYMYVRMCTVQTYMRMCILMCTVQMYLRMYMYGYYPNVCTYVYMCNVCLLHKLHNVHVCMCSMYAVLKYVYTYVHVYCKTYIQFIHVDVYKIK